MCPFIVTVKFIILEQNGQATAIIEFSSVSFFFVCNSVVDNKIKTDLLEGCGASTLHMHTLCIYLELEITFLEATHSSN